MIHNVGSADRVVRVVVGGALLDAIGPWGWLGLVPLTTGLLRICHAYRPFGLSTCRRRPASREPALGRSCAARH